jgi:hypothetical protein
MRDNRLGARRVLSWQCMTERAERPARPAARQSIGRKSQIAANARPPAPLCADLAHVTGPSQDSLWERADHHWIRSEVIPIVHQRTVSSSGLGIDRSRGSVSCAGGRLVAAFLRRRPRSLVDDEPGHLGTRGHCLTEVNRE